MQTHLRLSPCIALFVFIANCYAQKDNFRFKSYTKNDGLASNGVTAFVQTNDGYLWVGTNEGLTRFDGQTFKTFRNDINDTSSLSANHVTTLHVDRKGNLWVGTQDNGVNRYNRKTESFQRFIPMPRNSSSISHPHITEITEDSNHNLWVGTVMGLNLYQPGSDNFKRYFHEIRIYLGPRTFQRLKDQGIPGHVLASLAKLDDTLFTNREHFFSAIGSVLVADDVDKYGDAILTLAHIRDKGDNIRAIAPDEKGSLWLAFGEDGLGYFNPVTNRFVKYPIQIDPDHPFNQSYLTEVFHEGNAVWAGLRNGDVWTYNIADDSYQQMNIPFETYNIAAITSVGGEVWIGDDYGLIVCKLTGEGDVHEAIRHGYEKESQFCISPTAVKSIYQDKSDGVWIGTVQGGMNYVIPNSPFEVFTTKTYKNIRLTKNTVSSVLEDTQGNVWIGYFTMGVDFWEKSTGYIHHFEHDPYNKGSLGRGSVFEIFEDSQKNIWIGTYEGGLQKFNREKRTFYSYTRDEDDPHSIARNDVRSIVEDGDGNLWVALHGSGIDKLDLNTGRFEHFSADYLRWENSLVSDWTTTLLMTGDSLWVGTVSGFSILDMTSNRFSSFKTENSDLSNDYIQVLGEGEKGSIWIGTKNGLNLFDSKELNFKHYFNTHGLVDNSITGIFSEDDREVWVSTKNGFSLFLADENSFISLDELNILNASELFPAAVDQGKQTIYLGGLNGLITFDRQMHKTHLSEVSSLVTEMSVANEKRRIISYDPHEGDSCIFLSYQQNTFDISFSGVDFKSLEHMKHRFKLEGKDTTWNQVSGLVASYSDVPPGKYVFLLESMNGAGQWQASGNVLQIHVSPPYWKTSWAYLAYGTVVIAFFVMIFFSKKKTYKSEKWSSIEIGEGSVEDKIALLTSDYVHMEEADPKSGFIDQAMDIIHSNLSREDFGPDELAHDLHLSRSQLYKKIKRVSGISVGLLIRNARLEKASQLMKNEQYNIAEIAYKVGFSDPGYFSKCFKERYGKSPSNYNRKLAW